MPRPFVALTSVTVLALVCFVVVEFWDFPFARGFGSKNSVEFILYMLLFLIIMANFLCYTVFVMRRVSSLPVPEVPSGGRRGLPKVFLILTAAAVLGLAVLGGRWLSEIFNSRMWSARHDWFRLRLAGYILLFLLIMADFIYFAVVSARRISRIPAAAQRGRTVPPALPQVPAHPLDEREPDRETGTGAYAASGTGGAASGEDPAVGEQAVTVP
jgi:hypothetical protein